MHARGCCRTQEVSHPELHKQQCKSHRNLQYSCTNHKINNNKGTKTKTKTKKQKNKKTKLKQN